MRTLLLMLTDAFPYDQGEEFLEQEIEYLSDTADDIIIIPVRRAAGAQQTRRLPENARAILPDAKSATSRVKLLARHFLSAIPMTNWLPKKPVHLAVDLAFSTNAMDVYHRVKPRLATIDFSAYDAVVLYSYWFYTGVALAHQIQQHELGDIPSRIISRAHAYDVDFVDTPRGYLPSRPYLLKAVDEVATISDYAAKMLTVPYPEYAGKVVIRRLGVPAAQRVNRTLTQDIWLASCSHLAAYKRVGLIADTVAELKRRGHRVRWTHIGESDPKLLAELWAHIGTDTDGITLTGYLSNDEVRTFYRDNELTMFINSSDGEGVPVSIMEAQATGLPVVATDAGGTREIVHDGENGRIVPVECTGVELADAVQSIIDLGPEGYANYSAAAFQTWQSFSNAPEQYSQWASEIKSQTQALTQNDS